MDDQSLQGSQGSQDFVRNAPQHPDSHMPDPNESRPYNPYRADVDPKALTQRQRKYDDKKKLRKKDSKGLFVHDVSVVSARYDDQARKWMYTLNDWQNARISGETEEAALHGTPVNQAGGK